MTNDKAALKKRILTNDDLREEHAYVACMLLTMASGSPLAYRVSTGLVAVTWESPTRATITFVQEEQP